MGWQQAIGKGIQSFGLTMGAISRDKGIKSTEKKLLAGSNAADQVTKDYAGKTSAYYDPYAKVGINALNQMSSPSGEFRFRDSSEFLNNYFNSPEYSALNNQAMDQILRNQSATGGLRSGGSNVQLSNIAPTLGINALQRINDQDLTQYQVNQDRNRYLTDLGYNANIAQANITNTLGNNLANAELYRGSVRAGKERDYYNNRAQMHEDLGAVWGDYGQI